ncbi:MAG: fused MFS/spermidine synthase [Candidatus Moranbacteria bacterium]|nr:fused MFS/spermidine synthase [Candidatus Moranbacteria bacterium]
MKIQKYVLEMTVFLCGAIVMIFELVGSRMLGPYFGTSIFVWTSLIGIILGGLSLGYHLGGKIADKRATLKGLSRIIFLSAVLIGITLLIKNPLIVELQTVFFSGKTGLILSSLLLFLPVSISLGIVSPYAAKIKLKSLDNSGLTVGNLYAISTTGSIAGTFLSGFYLIPKFGTDKLLVILTVALTLNSFILSGKDILKEKLLALLLVLAGLFAVGGFGSLSEKESGLIDVDTNYNRVWIYDYRDPKSGRMVRTMLINKGDQSSMFLDGDDLANEYTKYYNLADHFNPFFKKTLMIGGAGYSYPKDFLSKYSDATIDVVEIDPQVTDLAKKYFKLKEDPRLKIYHEDGRLFMNDTQEKYDVIFGDAFGSGNSVPYQLTTKEAIQKKYEVLNPEGVVIVNIVASLEGEKGKFLRAEYATFKSVFPQVYLFPVNDPKNKNLVQNIMLVALKSEKKYDFNSENPELDVFLKNLWEGEIADDIPILTDDYAPVEYYTGKLEIF